MRTAITLSALWMAAAHATAQEFPSTEPTKYHTFLKQFEGDWTTRSKFIMDPSQPPVESKGSERARLAAGGLWLVIDYRSDLFGQDFSGHGVMGYDTLKKKYVINWVDSMTSQFKLGEGTCDESGKVFTLVYENADPGSGESMKMKQVFKIADKEKKTLTFFFQGPDGKYMNIGTIEYTRKEKGSKKIDKGPKPPKKP